MSSGARLQTFYGKEATPAGTVATWNTLRVTGNTIMPKNTLVKSDEITPNRLSGGSAITAVDVAGDINGELSYGTFDDFFAASFFNTWQALIAAPVQSAATTSATGGTLAAGTYYYKVTAINATGESIGSNEQSIATTGTLAAPVQSAPSTSTTGGTLAAATYYYKITALNANGETIGSNELSQITTGATSTVTVNWGSVAGATGYKIYRGTAAGAESVFYTVGAVVTFLDTGAASTAGTVPVTNTAGIGKNTISWATVSGATSYRIYRGTAAGLENKYFTVGAVLTFDDVGGVGSVGYPPTGKTGDVLSIGSVPSTLAIAKTYSDVGIYTIAKGCFVSKMVLTVPESGKLTTSFTMAALQYLDNTSAPYTVTPTAPTTTAFASSINIGDIKVDGLSLAGEACVTALDLTLDNNMKVQRCLGQGTNAGNQISGGADVTGSITLAWSVASYNIWKKMSTRATVSIAFPITFNDGSMYTIEIDKAEVDGDLPDGARTDIVNLKLNFTAVISSPTITRTPAP